MKIRVRDGRQSRPRTPKEWSRQYRVQSKKRSGTADRSSFLPMPYLIRAVAPFIQVDLGARWTPDPEEP